MIGLNTVTLLGTIGDRGVTVRPLASGTMQGSFILTVPEDNGFTLWIPCEAYGKGLEQAESLEPGDVVAVEGKLKLTSWTEKNGQKQRRLVVLAWSCKSVLVEVSIS